MQILLFQVQSVHKLAGPSFPVAFHSLSNYFIFKADNSSAYLAVIFPLPLPFEGCFALISLPPPLQLKDS